MPFHRHPRRRPRRATTLAALLLLASALVGCGGTTVDEGEAESGTLAERGIDETRGETGLADAGDPVRGGELAYALSNDTPTYCLTEALFSQSGVTVVRSM